MDFQVMASQLQPDLIAAIKRLVAIESVRGEASLDAPYGLGPKLALEEALQIARELGFETVNLDNQIGYALLRGNQTLTGYYGVFGHVDVVELGQGWQHQPLAGEIEDNRIYGRGVLDNKGPILANLFALAALKDQGVRFARDIRIVFGTNEETGFGCVKHYMTQENAPVFGWTPDCKWPVVYGERGRLRVRVGGENPASLYQFVNDYLLASPDDGRILGINYRDEDFGALLMRGYRLGEAGGTHFFEWSMSYPAACSQADLIAKIQLHLPNDLNLTVLSNWYPVLMDKTSPFVHQLQAVYNTCMGTNLAPVTTTGGTYAKIIPNLIAYGPSFPGQNGIAHLPDEWMDLSDLSKITEIYMAAFYSLKELEDAQ